MKRVLGLSVWVIMLTTTLVHAQTKVDDVRMTRDIEVAENVLNTLIKQQFEKRVYFPMNVDGEYMSGYGVTFRLPADYFGPMVMGLEGAKVWMESLPGSFSYSYNISSSDGQDQGVVERDIENMSQGKEKLKSDADRAEKERTRTMTVKKLDNASDSSRNIYNQRVIEASKTFLADYGDLISQLAPEEKILITNQGDGRKGMMMGSPMKRSYISIEATKGDLTQYRQGKLTKEQLAGKIRVVNSEVSGELDPDLELLSSIFSRLYQQDLSKTFFTERNIYYERLKDFGVIYYMQVYSSNAASYKNYSMPTQRLNDVDQKTRDAKVKELYPAFEKDIKENILDYGRTIKSLKDEESFIVNVKMTKCEGCGIPASLELSVKESVLKDFNSGKLTKDAALAKINVKKGTNQ